jgi:hypothetical protein
MVNTTFPDLILETWRISVSTSTGTDDASYKTIIYPNPVVGVLNIQSEQAMQKIELYTAAGIKVFEKEVDDVTTISIPAESLPMGLLLVRIYVNNKVRIVKVLKE